MRNGKRAGFDKKKQKKKFCFFCVEHISFIDYKDGNKLRRFLTERGKILPRRITGTCSKHQRFLTISIKRARELAVTSYISY